MNDGPVRCRKTSGGSPRRYYSSYSPEFLDALVGRLLTYRDAGLPVWTIFDNTAAGASIDNAMAVERRIAAACRHQER